MPRGFRHLVWIVAAATCLLCLVALITGDDDWLLAALVSSLATLVVALRLVFPEAFPAMQGLNTPRQISKWFTPWRLLGIGTLMIVVIIVVGLLIFAAGMAGFSGIR